MKLSTQILLAFLVILTLSLADTVCNYILSVKVKQNTEFFNRSQEIMRISVNLHKKIIETQSSFRGYLLTEDDTFLTAYDAGIKKIPALLNAQTLLVGNNTEQLQLVDSITMLHKRWVSYAATVIAARKQADVSAASEQAYNLLFETKLKKLVGKSLTDKIDEKFAQFDRAEYKTRSLHRAALLSSIKQTHFFSITFMTLTLAVGIIAIVYIVSLIKKRITTMVGFAERISAGEFTPLDDRGNDELKRLSGSLNIMSARLQSSIEELKKRNTELDKFAYVVSHDLKAPLRGIHNVVQWIEEDLKEELSPKLKHYLDIIPTRVQRMENLINGLLDYARVRERKPLEITDVNEMIRAVIESIVPRNFTVETENLPVITTERLKLEQVFTNLISNAVKYTTREDGLITIGCREQDEHYEFSVADNGIGIEAEYHSKIFEMFQTLREKDEMESTGIGLAIIKRILEEQHCKIWVHSAYGQGATFTFTWPRN